MLVFHAKDRYKKENPIKTESELEKLIYQDAAILLYNNSVVGLLITFCSSSVLVFGFDNPDANDFQRTWWAILCVILLCRAIDAIWWHKMQLGHNFDGRKASYRYISGIITVSIMWCIYSLYMLRHSDVFELTSNIMVLSAIAGGAATILAAHKYASIAFISILLIPFCLALTLSYDGHRFLLGLLGLCFSVTLMLTANKSANFTRQSLRFKHENEVLVHRMEEQVELRTNRIYELSNIDPLTGLLNRTAFLSQLGHELNVCASTKQPLALLFIDLDGFKKVNDTIGHEIGDKVLTLTAKRLLEANPENGILCRWGGDEFIMALPKTEGSAAIVQANQIIKQLSKTYKFNDNSLSIGATIGIAMSPEHSLNASMLIRLADTAMYYQKKLLPSKAYVFSEQLGKQVGREHLLKAGLSQAITKEQLRLVFQPIVRSDNGEILAFEALLRWRFGNEHIQPNEFIRVAEQYGMIKEIGEWVLNEACRIASNWDKAKNIIVNVSVIQLQDNSFIDMVETVLRKHQLPHDLLNIEITESVLASSNQVTRNMDRLQEIGVNVSIDDFGTGYSSLSVIQDLGVDIVKIDRSFIDNLDTNGMAIVQAIMNISSSLNYSVIAEGVETSEQAQQLTNLGVHFQQGFHFSKPMEHDQIENFMVSSTKAEMV